MKKNSFQPKIAAAQLLMFAAMPMAAPTIAQESSAFLLEEVVVTARRKDESLQDVPQTVNAIGSDTFESLNILDFEDMESVVPGVSLDSSSNGFSTQASMRGVDFSVESGVAPAVEFYLNDAPVESNQIFTQVFDVGQVEVLSGPQGTLRGRSAPSGAITVKTREANLYEVGGYLSTSQNNKGGSNYQGAINLPIIQDKLAVRVAAVFDENEVDGVDSYFHNETPDSDVDGARITIGFAPTDTFDGQLMHQRINKDLVSFYHQAGENTTIGHLSALGKTDVDDRKSLGASPNYVENELEVTTLNLNWAVGDHQVNYVGQYSKFLNLSNSPYDQANQVLSSNGGSLTIQGVGTLNNYDEWYQDLSIDQQQESHELRISLEEPIGGIFTYTAGIFYQEKNGKNNLNSNTIVSADLSPGFASFNPSATGGAWILTNEIYRPSETDELSVFANGTVFLTDYTELSVGARHIHSHNWNETVIAGNSISEIKGEDDEVIWNVSLSHRINEDLMVYSNVGTAVRPGPVGALGVNSLANPDDNMLRVIADRDNERSTSYEIGFKADFMEGRGRLNAAYYFQDFEGYIYYSPQTQYFGTNGIENFSFTSNVDAEVQGIDLDVTFQLQETWNVSGVLSWTDSQLKGDVPCNDGNLDGSPDRVDPSVSGSLNAGNQVAFCNSSDSASSAPDWTASVRSEYFTEMAGMEAYLRGIYSYFPENDNKQRYSTVDNYGLLNVYVGLRDFAGNWDVQVFAKNITGEEETLSYDDLQVLEGGTLSNYLGESGYYETSMTPRRELGVSLRYNF